MGMRRCAWDLLVPVINIKLPPLGCLSVYHLDFVCPSSLCRWNQLDLAIVLLSIVGITLEEIEMNAALPINPTIIRIMRVLRIARGVSCSGGLQPPRETLWTFVLPALLVQFQWGT